MRMDIAACWQQKAVPTLLAKKILSIIWDYSSTSPANSSALLAKKNTIYYMRIALRCQQNKYYKLPYCTWGYTVAVCCWRKKYYLVHEDFLSCRKFCPSGRFVPALFFRRTFCPSGHFFPRTLCPYGSFGAERSVVGRFVWPPLKVIDLKMIGRRAGQELWWD